ncbi:FAD-dependent oxidoreductase [Agromyces sp. GXQ0307]|uniref:FAD-dependent oxidoreductase n=1 Tax=Agromyces sp. GXQ0307 TaxID=3377835 RepID=UPI00383B1C72
MPRDPDADVIVVGAGLAGLRCATRLAGSGHHVVVLEADDRVGGRQRTDEVDGFLLDRGFQVLNPAYPAVKRWADVAALGLQRFPAGVRVRREERTVELADPRRHPTRIPATLASGLVRPGDLLGLARWALPALLRPRRIIGGPDRALRDGWDRAGLRGPLRTEVLEPFLAGVLACDDGSTSDSFVRLLVRMFALGSPGVPERGIAALPAQLADAARAAGAEIRLEARVQRLRAGAGPSGAAAPAAAGPSTTGARRVEVDVVGAGSLRAAAVVVAVGPDAVADLAGVPRPVTRGLQTWWFAPDVAPTTSATIAVDGRRRGPVVNTVVISNAAPSYAPSGRHLVEATCLLPAAARSDAAAAPTEQDVRRHLSEIWGTEASAWPLLRRDDLPDALPAQPPPLRTTTPARLRDGVYVAGDHRNTASIQGALVSGDRVARAVLADLRGA